MKLFLIKMWLIAILCFCAGWSIFSYLPNNTFAAGIIAAIMAIAIILFVLVGFKIHALQKEINEIMPRDRDILLAKKEAKLVQDFKDSAKKSSND